MPFLLCSLLAIAAQDRPQLMPTDKAIKLFEARSDRDPRDYRSRTMLGRLYERKAKETDDFSSFLRAEQAFRSALKIKPDDRSAKGYLAGVLASQHKFKEAAELSEGLLKADPKSPQALAVLGDSRLELGQYAEAEKVYEKLLALEKSPPVLSRVARLRELTGKSDEALELLKRAMQDHRASAGLPEKTAWYEWRLGVSLSQLGRHEEAAKHFEAALELVPDDAPALAGLAATHAARGQFKEAVTTYERAIKASDEPPFHAALGDVYARMGNESKAKEHLDIAEAGMAEEAKDPASAAAHGREVALFYADHDRHLPEALEIARKDFAQRQDIYAHDTLAWALFKNGKAKEAAGHMKEALKLGTQDAKLYRHAVEIFSEIGAEEQAAKARKALKSLGN